MQLFISNLTNFIIGFFEFFVVTTSGQFILVFALVLFVVLYIFKYFGLL